MSSGPGDGDVESSAVFGEAQVSGSDAAEDDDVSLGTLEGIYGGDLDLFEGLVVEVLDLFFELVHLSFVCQDNSNGVVRPLSLILYIVRHILLNLFLCTFTLIIL